MNNLFLVESSMQSSGKALKYLLYQLKWQSSKRIDCKTPQLFELEAARCRVRLFRSTLQLVVHSGLAWARRTANKSINCLI